jgi:hypothetical protein
MVISSIKKKVKAAVLSAFPELALQVCSIRSRRMIESGSSAGTRQASEGSLAGYKTTRSPVVRLLA